MKKVNLRMFEQEKYDIIKNLVNNKNGNKRIASIKINCSLRTINRLIIKYKTKGKVGFIHGNRDSKPKSKMGEKIKQEIINLYQSNQYCNANFNHFRELLLIHKNINVSYGFIHQLLLKVGILSPRCHRATKRRKAKMIKEQLKIKLGETQKSLVVIKNLNKNQQIESLKISREIPDELGHPRKPRKKYFGEEIQMDASHHLWFGETKSHLHLAIDDSTSTIVAAYFVKEETLFGYYKLMYQILTNYGIPHSIKTDNRMIFTNNKKENPDLVK